MAPPNNRPEDQPLQPAGSKSQNVHAQVNEVVGIMQNNIEKVMERGEKLETLSAKTEDLQNSSHAFKKGASKVRKAMWWKDMKLKLMIAAVVIIILIIVLVPVINNIRTVTSGAPAAAAVGQHKNDSPSDDYDDRQEGSPKAPLLRFK